MSLMLKVQSAGVSKDFSDCKFVRYILLLLLLALLFMALLYMALAVSNNGPLLQL